MIRVALSLALTLVLAHPSLACGTAKGGAACDPAACHTSMSHDGKVGAEKAVAPAANTETKTLTITGMSCAGCANKISKTLKANPAITAAVIDHETGLATITYVKGQITEADITALIEKAGYKADKTHV